jgi:hypothetical protein
MISPLRKPGGYRTVVDPSECNLSDEFACPVPHDHVVQSLWRLMWCQYLDQVDRHGSHISQKRLEPRSV